MGKMGKQDGQPGKSLGNPQNMLKNFRVGGHGHTIFYFRP